MLPLPVSPITTRVSFVRTSSPDLFSPGTQQDDRCMHYHDPEQSMDGESSTKKHVHLSGLGRCIQYEGLPTLH